MSPARIHGDGEEKRVINGPRPTPLRINKDSNVIQKPSFPYSRSSSSMSSLVASSTRQQNRMADHKQQNPIIIYAHSPKIIHTKPRDFMALVQKLTGLSRSDKETAGAKPQSNSLLSKEVKNDQLKPVKVEDNINGAVKYSSSSFSPTFVADIPPLYTPNSTGFFFSPRPLYRYAETISPPPPNMASSTSPYLLEATMELPQY